MPQLAHQEVTPVLVDEILQINEESVRKNLTSHGSGSRAKPDEIVFTYEDYPKTDSYTQEEEKCVEYVD